MSSTYGKASWPIPALTDAPNAQTMIQAVATQIDPFVTPRYASSAAFAAANPTPSDGDTWYRTDLSQGFEYRNLGGGLTLPNADSHGYLAEITLGTTVTTIQLTSIPSTYSHLKLILQGRSAAASGGNGFDELYIRFNADGGSNYSSHAYIAANLASSTNPIVQELDATNTPRFGVMPNGATGNGIVVLDIPLYAGTQWQKQYTGTFHASSGVGSPNNKYHGVCSGVWSSTVAISGIYLSTSSGSGFVTGTKVGVYGYGSGL